VAAYPYHEAFWVVAGTAAPVIALAVIVVMPDILIRGATALGQKAKGGPDRRSTIGLAFVALLIAVALLTFQASALVFSLDSIANADNEVSPRVVEAFTGPSITGLMLIVILSGLIRYQAAGPGSASTGEDPVARPVRSPAPRPVRARARRMPPRWQSRPPLRTRRPPSE
jgi:hypothetical protein